MDINTQLTMPRDNPIGQEDFVLPPSFWLIVCAYLLVAAFTLLRAQFRAAEDVAPGIFTLCFAALVFAATWPSRAVRRALRLFGWSA